MKLLALVSVAAALGNYAVSANPVPKSNNGNNGQGNNGNNGQGNNGHSGSTTPVNELYQYSVIAALVDGVASHGTLVKNVMAHGDLGLGTFDSLIGEMVVVDGVVYHAFANKTVTVVDPETIETPFAAVTTFESQIETSAAITNFTGFTASLPTWFGNTSITNHFAAYRLEGTFNLRIRAPGGQCFALESLANVTARQTEWEYTNIEGTMVGFRTPKYAAEVNAAGDHLHFINANRTIAGHVLEVASVGNVDIKLAKITNIHVEVPSEGEFNLAAFV